MINYKWLFFDFSLQPCKNSKVKNGGIRVQRSWSLPPLGLLTERNFTMLYSLCIFFSSSKGTIMERAMLITPKEFEACTNSPSPIRLALSPLPPALVPFFPSLPLHHRAFFLPLYTQICCSDYFQLERRVNSPLKKSLKTNLQKENKRLA